MDITETNDLAVVSVLCVSVFPFFAEILSWLDSWLQQD